MNKIFKIVMISNRPIGFMKIAGILAEVENHLLKFVLTCDYLIKHILH